MCACARCVCVFLCIRVGWGGGADLCSTAYLWNCGNFAVGDAPNPALKMAGCLQPSFLCPKTSTHPEFVTPRLNPVHRSQARSKVKVLVFSQYTFTPKVGKIIAPNPQNSPSQTAIMIHTFGVRIDRTEYFYPPQPRTLNPKFVSRSYRLDIAPNLYPIIFLHQL